RPPDRADANRVLAARAVHAQSPPGAHALRDLRAGLGLRLRLRLQLARRVHRLPAAQDRSGRRASADPDRPRRRLRTAGAMSFRARLTLVAAAAVALAVVAASAVVFLVVRGQLRKQVDDALRNRAGELMNGPGPGLHIDNGFLDVHGPRFGAPLEFIQAVPASGA